MPLQSSQPSTGDIFNTKIADENIKFFLKKLKIFLNLLKITFQSNNVILIIYILYYILDNKNLNHKLKNNVIVKNSSFWTALYRTPCALTPVNIL